MFSLRSYLTGLWASGAYGRALKLQRQGRVDGAIEVAREALTRLRAQHVVRDNPGEGSVLLGLTMLVEHLAAELRQPGAHQMDLRDSLRFLEGLADAGNDTVRTTRTEWLPYLRGRLQDGESS